MSQNLRIATWIPTDRVAVGESVVSQAAAGPGQAVTTNFVLAGTGGGGGGTVPPGTIVASVNPPIAPIIGDMWIDLSNPNIPQVKVFKQGNAWVVLANTDLLPKATQPGELLVSGPGPTFDWNNEQGLIEGVY